MSKVQLDVSHVQIGCFGFWKCFCCRSAVYMKIGLRSQSKSLSVCTKKPTTVARYATTNVGVCATSWQPVENPFRARSVAFSSSSAHMFFNENNSVCLLCSVRTRVGPRCSFVSLRRHPTGQISTGWHGVPQRAVDGNANRHYGRNSCTHTLLVNRPWWFVDLGPGNSMRPVCSVRLHNRQDCCKHRLTRFRIFVTNKRPIPGRAFTIPRGNICYDYASSATFDVRTFACRRRLRGRYVGVQLMKRDYLTLCEVQVFLAPPGLNVSHCSDSFFSFLCFCFCTLTDLVRPMTVFVLA